MAKSIINTKFFWIIFIIYNLLTLNSNLFSIYFYILSLGIFFFNVVPIINFYLNYKIINFIPLYHFTHIYFFFCYTIALFFPYYLTDIFEVGSLRYYVDGNNGIEDIFLNGITILLIGLLFFSLGNFVVSYFLKTNLRSNNFFSFKENYNEILFLGISFYLVSLAFILLADFSIFQKIYQIKYPLLYLSIISIQLFINLKKDLRIIYKCILYLLIFLICFLEILDGSIAKSFLYLISIYLINFIVTKEINFKFLFLILITSILLHTFKYEYRNVTWLEGDVNDTLINTEIAKKERLKEKHSKLEKSKLFFTTYKNILDPRKFKENVESQNITSIANLFMNRNYDRLTHSFQSLLIVTTLSPKEVPYWKGYSYKILLTKFIPRIFWENKPSDTLGLEFGKRYKILDQSDNSTSWNMPVLNELYVNFGIIGIIIGMFFLGLIFSFVPLILNYRYDNYLFVITFITLYPLFYLESHLSLSFGAVIQTFIFLFVILFFFKIFLSVMKKFF